MEVLAGFGAYGYPLSFFVSVHSNGVTGIGSASMKWDGVGPERRRTPWYPESMSPDCCAPHSTPGVYAFSLSRERTYLDARTLAVRSRHQGGLVPAKLAERRRQSVPRAILASQLEFLSHGSLRRQNILHRPNLEFGVVADGVD